MNLKSVFALLIASSAVLAMGDDVKPIGFAARVGAFLPLDSNTQSVGNSWLDFGIDFDIKQISETSKGASSLALSLDYAYRQNYRVLPLVLNYVRHAGPVYVFGGVGANFSDIPTATGTDDQARFAYDLGIGYDFLKNGGTPVFVEGRFIGNQKSDLNGVGVFLGIRL